MDITIERISNELKFQNKKQQDLTKFLGIGHSSFGNWKAGLNKSYLKYLHAIADFLDVSVEYLKGETDKKEKPPIEVDKRFKEMFDLTADLSDSEIMALKSFVAGLKANRQ